MSITFYMERDPTFWTSIVKCDGCGEVETVTMHRGKAVTKAQFNWDVAHYLEEKYGYKPLPGRIYCPECKRLMRYIQRRNDRA